MVADVGSDRIEMKTNVAYGPDTRLEYSGTSE